MKNKIKKLKLPLSKMTGNEKDYAAVLLEDVNSNMKAFWEVLHSVKEKGDATFEQVGAMTEKINMVEAEQAITNKRLDSIEGKIDNINKEKFDPNKFLELEKRMGNIETRIKVNTF